MHHLTPSSSPVLIERPLSPLLSFLWRFGRHHSLPSLRLALQPRTLISLALRHLELPCWHLVTSLILPRLQLVSLLTVVSRVEQLPRPSSFHRAALVALHWPHPWLHPELFYLHPILLSVILTLPILQQSYLAEPALLATAAASSCNRLGTGPATSWAFLLGTSLPLGLQEQHSMRRPAL